MQEVPDPEQEISEKAFAEFEFKLKKAPQGTLNDEKWLDFY